LGRGRIKEGDGKLLCFLPLPFGKGEVRRGMGKI